MIDSPTIVVINDKLQGTVFTYFWCCALSNCHCHSTYPTLCYKEMCVSQKIRVLASGTLFHTLDTKNFVMAYRSYLGLQCCWLGGRKGIRPVKKTEWWDTGVAVCLEWCADLHRASWCHCHSLSLASVKSRLVLPFWYWLTWVVPEKGPLNGCVCAFSITKLRKVYCWVCPWNFFNQWISGTATSKQVDCVMHFLRL